MNEIVQKTLNESNSLIHQYTRSPVIFFYKEN
jgi:hypothetical protein